MISFILNNIPIFALALACVIALIRRKGLVDYIMLLPIGIGGLWAFYMQTFQSETMASAVGWKASPFQFEVGVAYLGIGIMGIMSFWQGKQFRLAVAVMAFVFYWGTSVGYFHELYYYGGDLASAQASMILYTNILIPAALWVAFSLDL